MNRWTAATRRVYFSSGHGRQPRAPFSPRASPSFPRNGRHASHNSRRGDNRRGDNSRRQPRRHRHDGAAAKRAWKHAASFSAKVGAAKFPDRSARASHARNGGGEATAPAATTTVAAEKRMNRFGRDGARQRAPPHPKGGACHACPKSAPPSCRAAATPTSHGRERRRSG